MRNRDNKIFAANSYYHLYNRGVAKMEVFKDSADLKFFLSRLRENLFPSVALANMRRPLEGSPRAHSQYKRKLLPSDAFCLLCYCLMPNHFHLLIRQATNLAISKLIAKVCTGYSVYFNKKYGRVGPVFQDAFKAVQVETDAQLLWLSAYIHQNPKVADLVGQSADYPWSSYPDYLSLRNDTVCDKDFLIKMVGSPQLYQIFVEGSLGKIQQRKELEHLFLDAEILLEGSPQGECNGFNASAHL